MNRRENEKRFKRNVHYAQHHTTWEGSDTEEKKNMIHGKRTAQVGATEGDGSSRDQKQQVSAAAISQ